MTPAPPEPEPESGPAGDVFRPAALDQLRSTADHSQPPDFDDRRARRAFWPIAVLPLVAAAAAFGVRVEEKVPAPTQGQNSPDVGVRSERLLVVLVRPLFGGDEP